MVFSLVVPVLTWSLAYKWCIHDILFPLLLQSLFVVLDTSLSSSHKRIQLYFCLLKQNTACLVHTIMFAPRNVLSLTIVLSAPVKMARTNDIVTPLQTPSLLASWMRMETKMGWWLICWMRHTKMLRKKKCQLMLTLTLERRWSLYFIFRVKNLMQSIFNPLFWIHQSMDGRLTCVPFQSASFVCKDKKSYCKMSMFCVGKLKKCSKFSWNKI